MAFRSVVGGAALAGAAALAYAAAVEVRWYTLRRFVVPVLPDGAGEVRVLHLSDLHLLPTQDHKVEWVRSLAALDPHLVVTTGDNIAHLQALPALLHAYEQLLERPGAFVLGSNDYFAPRPKNPARYLLADAREANPAPRLLPFPEMTAAFRAAGWKDLTNRRDAVVLGEGDDALNVALVGVDDPHLDRDRFPATTRGHAQPTAVGGTVGRGTLRLGVAHAPYRRVLDAMHDDGADLILAGHTHGGQLCVPGWGALVTNCDLDTRRAKGLHGWPGARPDAPGGAGSSWLHVSAGLGTSPYAPVRFACRPEATLLTLVPRES
ncbi:metallophosphoesterase [Actinotalea fermentans]|uniref:Metallophosphoesterase n=1 Tax=Actinotalea fermentans TaxID=43671 RepID=A0A511Z0R4_9CELL|nr:metallophosphoesterase [Actinotalea fermentans]KGM16745.1 metallophosphoesterase [Actinotalea fermentans ATCC 43279 = JCM 9966 = DSM 3133]GEN81029.1 metallophosphoesterase [Actinotalea fermentans]